MPPPPPAPPPKAEMQEKSGRPCCSPKLHSWLTWCSIPEELRWPVYERWAVFEHAPRQPRRAGEFKTADVVAERSRLQRHSTYAARSAGLLSTAADVVWPLLDRCCLDDN